jgi:hypothetical protein
MRTISSMMLLGSLACVSPPTMPSTMLAPGMELIYQSGEHRGTGSRVEAVTVVAPPDGRAHNCVRVHYAAAAGETTGVERVTCEVDGMLQSLDSTGTGWRTVRPLQPGKVWSTPPRNGRVSHYTAIRTHEEQISSRTVLVVETEVLTDSAGRPVRRLRERYAPALGTATGGVFEAADSSVAGGWRVTRRFELVEIVIKPGLPDSSASR